MQKILLAIKHSKLRVLTGTLTGDCKLKAHLYKMSFETDVLWTRTNSSGVSNAHQVLCGWLHTREKQIQMEIGSICMQLLRSKLMVLSGTLTGHYKLKVHLQRISFETDNQTIFVIGLKALLESVPLWITAGHTCQISKAFQSLPP